VSEEKPLRAGGIFRTKSLYLKFFFEDSAKTKNSQQENAQTLRHKSQQLTQFMKIQQHKDCNENAAFVASKPPSGRAV